MKTKLGILFALVGVSGIVAMIVLLILQVFEFDEWWVDYAFGVGALLIVIPLNFRSAKKDEYYDALRNVKESRYALSQIDAKKRVGLLKLQAARNQLAELAICFREIVTERDLFALLPLLERVEQAENHYKEDDDFRAALTEEIVDGDLQLVGEVEDVLLRLREQKR